MFSNLQNKIDLKKIREEKVTIDKDFAFKEDFDVVTQTLNYFKEKKNEPKLIIIEEEVVEVENQESIDLIDDNIKDLQSQIYNDEDLSSLAKEVLSDEEFNENFNKYHKERGILPSLLEAANNELIQELDKYRMVDGDDLNKEDFEADAFFDKEALDLARKEYLDNIYTYNWLDKQLVEYKKNMGDLLNKPGKMTIVNNLKKLDVNDTEEIKNTIKSIQESVTFLKLKKNKEVK